MISSLKSLRISIIRVQSLERLSELSTVHYTTTTNNNNSNSNSNSNNNNNNNIKFQFDSE